MSMLLMSCADPHRVVAAQGGFNVSTESGIVSAQVDGFATGVTHQSLTRLVIAGVAEFYAVTCEPSDANASVTNQMIWRVTNNGRIPTAVISVDLLQNGRIIRSAFVNTTAPGASPDSVFISQIAALARRILPAPIGPIGQSPGRCVPPA